MGSETLVSDVRFVAAPEDLRARGLFFFVELTYGDLRIAGITVRRTRHARFVLSFPVRHDSRGDQRSIVRPVDDAARRAIEAQVFAALNFERELRPQLEIKSSDMAGRACGPARSQFKQEDLRHG